MKHIKISDTEYDLLKVVFNEANTNITELVDAYSTIYGKKINTMLGEIFIHPNNYNDVKNIMILYNKIAKLAIKIFKEK